MNWPAFLCILSIGFLGVPVIVWLELVAENNELYDWKRYAPITLFTIGVVLLALSGGLA